MIVVRIVKRGFLGLVVVCVLVGVGGVTPAFAASPWWQLTSSVRPAHLPPGGEGTISVKAINMGDASTSGPVTLSDVLPTGVTAAEDEIENPITGEMETVPRVQFFAFPVEGGATDVGPGGGVAGALYKLCKMTGSTVSCGTFSPLGFEPISPVAPYEDLEMRITVKVNGAESGSENRAEVSGGEARGATSTRPITVSGTPTPFGLEDVSVVPEEEGGGVDAQAGSHPFQLNATLAINQNADPIEPPALVRNLHFKLPPGLVGNTTALPQCSDLDFRHLINGTGTANHCPASTVLGVAILTVDEPAALGLRTLPVPLFNLVPGRGEPARFGFEFAGTPVTLDTSVRTGSDYGVNVDVSNITELTSFLSATVVFWGVPGDPSHNPSRGWGCLAERHWGQGAGLPCEPPPAITPPPFLTLPTSCAGPFATTVEGDSWPIKAEPGAEPASMKFAPFMYSLKDSFGRELGMTGCNQLPFKPEIKVTPDVQEASTPTGLTATVHVPQEVSENPVGLASSSVKDINVTLPAGVGLNPAGADGLEACSEAMIGYLPGESDPAKHDLHFTPKLPEPFEPGNDFCGDGAKIATVKIKTPLILDPVEGAVYLASQNRNPFGSLIAMYIVAQDPISGTLLKLPGEVSLDEATGQVSASFKNSPQLPFEDAELHFFGGDRAPLGTPALCGSYTTQASFAPWSEEPGEPAHTSSSTFDIKSGPNGGPCNSPLPFNPSLTAGTTSIQAGGFSPFTTTMSREDGNQDLQAIVLHMPPGVSGLLSSVKLCPEAQANAGTCGADSQIGETIVSVGLGSNPFSVTGGKVFVTEGYGGAPYGLSIVNPAKAGPFDLGKVVVRAKIEVDPITAALTITTDNTGLYKIPHILKGIPLQIKHVNVTINRPGFTFNPTNCNPMSITGSLSSTEGSTKALSVPLQVTNCAVLGFKPQFSVSTSGKTSRQKGASLHVKLAYPKAPFGSQANIAKVKVDLPKQLPSRLTTLQKACPDRTFNANPAGCGVESRIGEARATTPLLPVPLSGPVYFVSHGGAKFPELVIVLSGYGTTVQLHAETFISKAGITSSTFRTVPDVPVGTFELTLPQGKFSALAANGNLCKSKLRMPTTFTAQNGAQIKQSTPIGVTGCARHKAKKAAKHRKKR